MTLTAVELHGSELQLAHTFGHDRLAAALRDYVYAPMPTQGHAASVSVRVCCGVIAQVRRFDLRGCRMCCRFLARVVCRNGSTLTSSRQNPSSGQQPQLG